MGTIMTTKNLAYLAIPAMIFTVSASAANTVDVPKTVDQANQLLSAASRNVGSLISAWPVGPRKIESSARYKTATYDGGSFTIAPGATVSESRIRTIKTDHVAVVSMSMTGNCIKLADIKNTNDAVHWIGGTAGDASALPRYYSVSDVEPRVIWGFDRSGEHCLKTITLRPD